MREAGRSRELGTAIIEPDAAVVAGSYGTWRLSFSVGQAGLARGAKLRVHTDSDTDWAIPQFDDPSGPDYMSVQAPAGAQVGAMTQGFRGLVVTNLGRALAEGERLTLVYGDRSLGGPGSRAQTFVERRRYLSVDVDPDATGAWQPLADRPCVRIVGGDAVLLVVVAPSTVAVDQTFDLLVRAQDAWGNPSASFRGTVEVALDGLAPEAARHAFIGTDEGVWWLRGCRLAQAGLCRVTARQVDGPLEAESNPVACGQDDGGPSLHWGDPHGGQLVMADKIPDFFRYARDVSGIAFTGYQPNGHRVTTEDWAIQQTAEQEAYAPGVFVPMPGFEWTGEVSEGGHHNVYFRRQGQPIRRSCHLENLVGQDDQASDLPHILDVHAAYRGTDTVITPHVGGGRADLTHHDPSLEPAIEVTSTHGSFPWFLEDALRRGYQVGFIGGSDGYTGRPGGEYPGYQERRYAKGGLTGLYAQELTIEGVLTALKARHAYGTTGARMLIRVESDGHMMGDSYRTRRRPALSVSVAGTAPIEVLELYRGLERVYSHRARLDRSPKRVRILWEGASRRTSYSGVIWDGELRAQGGTIAVSEQIRFDSPRSHLHNVSPAGLRWHSVTCGYRSGIIIDVEGSARLEAKVSTSLLSMPGYGGFGDQSPKRISYSPAERLCFAFDLQGLAEAPVSLDVGPLDRRITASLAPTGGERDVTFAFEDPAPRPGINAYWLRVIQTDGEMAWTSPVYVDYAGDGG